MAAPRRESWLPDLPSKLDSMRGPAQTNWLIKGMVLVGAHPGQISTTEMVKNLTSILEAGITTFVCLQSEMPSPLSSAHHPRVGTAGAVEGVTARPYINDAQIIVDHGRGRFPQRDPLSFVHLPIPNTGGAIIDDGQLVACALDLIGHLKAGERLYVHCDDGNGRTGSMACLLLGLLYQLSSSETLDLVQTFRNHRAGTQGHMPDSHEQKMQVHRILADERLRKAIASVPAAKSSDPEKALEADVSVIVEKVRAGLARRGTTSVIALARAFKIMDDDNSKQLSMYEFTKGMRDMGIGLTKPEVEAVFAYYDKDGSGELGYDEFLRGVRGRMNERRLKLVHGAFAKLDADGNGHIMVNDIAHAYNTRKHPDVAAGKKTEKQVMEEFLTTFECGDRDGRVTLQEFEDYYNNISASIDDDNYFQLMMWNAWPFAGKADTSGRRRVGGPRFGTTSRAGAGAGAGAGSATASRTALTSRAGTKAGMAIYGAGSTAATMRTGAPVVSAPGAGGSQTPEQIIKTMRALMKRRGARGIVGMGRSFRIMDDDRSGQLSRDEFGKALRDVGVRVSRPEADGLFAYFDTDNSGQIHYEEFLKAVRGPMSERRKALVRLAFKKLDRDSSNVVEVPEVASAYNAERHPKVLSGEKSPDEVYREFLDTFDGGEKDGLVHPEEFQEYYENISMSIDNDDYFELMMTNAWNLDGKTAAKKGWSNSNGTSAAAHAPARGTPRRGREAWGSSRAAAAPARASPASPSRRVLVPGGAGATPGSSRRRGKKTVGGRQSNTYRSNVPWDTRDTAMASTDEVARLRAAYVSPAKAQKVLAAAGMAEAGARRGSGTGAGAGAGAGASAASSPLAATIARESGGAPRGVERVQSRLREQLKRRGARGIIGLGRAFKIFDDDGSRSLNRYEFGKALKDYGLSLSNAEVNLLFNYYDRNGDGSISYNEFIVGVRGKLNPRRKELVRQAYNKLDADGNGVVNIDDIRLTYDASRHPSVLSGKKTEAQILRSFLDTFDVGEKDGVVHLEEFEEYYANISASIDDDNYFQLMMWNAWKLQEGPTRAAAGVSSLGRHGRRGEFSSTLGGQSIDRPHKPLSSRGWVADFDAAAGSVDEEVPVEDVLKRVRTTVARRGANSMAGLARAFKIFDDDRSGGLSVYEFSKAMRDYGLGLSEAELRALFHAFDRDGNGEIKYMEFIRGVRGAMSDRRKELVMQAFDRMDADGSGELTADDLRGCYNARMSKEVMSGKKTERQVLASFLGTFDTLEKDGVVTREEFLEYYENISASIDDDSYFHLMMWNAWNLGGKTVKRGHKKAWGGQF